MFDPLDGSSNVDAGIPTGTIFGIFEDDQTCIVPEEGCAPRLGLGFGFGLGLGLGLGLGSVFGFGLRLGLG